MAFYGDPLLWLALACSVIAMVSGRRGWLWAAAGFLWAASAILLIALVTTDFSLVYVARTTSLSTPWPYRVAAFWGGMEGSLLFYVALTASVGAVGVRYRWDTRIVAAVVLFLAAISSVAVNPFATMDVPAVDGEGLLAILQHPAMIYHPPILYLGLVSLVVPFASTFALLRGETDRIGWFTAVRPWLLGSWLLLTVGMAAGSNWAYVELGWGGFWAWDPVENTSLMPWLAITAFMHLSLTAGAEGRFRRSLMGLAVTPFVLSLVGVYLTRSGVTGSIHSFAEDPRLGRMLLVASGLTAVAVGVAITRADKGIPVQNWRLDRAGWLTLSGLASTLAMALVLVGSAYPAVSSVFLNRAVSVAPRFFVVTIFPVALVMIVGVALSMRVHPFVLAVVGVSSVSALGLWLGFSAAVLLAGVALAVVVLLLAEFRHRSPSARRNRALIAHVGVAILLGAFGASALGDTFRGTMRPGDSVVVAGEEFTLLGVEIGERGRISFAQATFQVGDRLMKPEIRAYETQTLPVAEPVLLSSPFRDRIAAISLLFPDAETVEVSLFVRPMVWWVWVGAALLALSGLLYFVSRGEAVSERRPAATARQPRADTTT